MSDQDKKPSTPTIVDCPKHGPNRGIRLHLLQGKKDGPKDLVCIRCVAERMVQPVRNSTELRASAG